MILVTEELITASLKKYLSCHKSDLGHLETDVSQQKMISVTTKNIFTTEKVITATLKVVSFTTKWFWLLMKWPEPL